jgi:hypothetical protein
MAKNTPKISNKQRRQKRFFLSFLMAMALAK